MTVLPCSVEEMLNFAVTLSLPLLEHIHCLVVTLGANGVLLCGEQDAGSVNLQPRQHRRVWKIYTYLLGLAGNNSEYNDDFLLFLVFPEQTVVCCTLPGTECDCSRDGKCVRSRRQVLNRYLPFISSFPVFLFPLQLQLLFFQDLSCVSFIKTISSKKGELTTFITTLSAVLQEL